MNPDEEVYIETHSEEDDPTVGTFTDLALAVIKPPQWVIDDFLPVGLTFFAAPPKAGKSSLTMAAACLVGGHECKVVPEWMRFTDGEGTVMIFSAEAEAGELKDMVVNGMGVTLTPGRILIADDPWTFRLDDPKPGGWSRMKVWLDARKPKLVIVDPLRDFHGLDENDAGDINRLLRPIRQWAMANGASCVIVHHTKKPGDNHQHYKATDMRGTSALFGIADGVLMATPVEGKTNTVTIEATFKRARGWKRNIQLAIYEDKDRPACEVLSQGAKDLQFYLDHGAPETLDEIQSRFPKAGSNLKENLLTLKRNGLALLSNGKWRKL